MRDQQARDMIAGMAERATAAHRATIPAAARSMIDNQLLLLLVQKTDLLAGLSDGERATLESVINTALSLTDLMDDPSSLQAYAELVRSRLRRPDDGR